MEIKKQIKIGEHIIYTEKIKNECDNCVYHNNGYCKQLQLDVYKLSNCLWFKPKVT